MNHISCEYIKVSINTGESRPYQRSSPCGEIPMGTGGIEPPSSALEADILPVYDAPTEL